MSNENRNKIMSLVDEGLMDAEAVLSILINNWMSDHDVGEMIESMVDFEDLREAEEFEPEVDGIQYRYKILDDNPLTFSAEIYRIDAILGDDEAEPCFTVTPDIYREFNEDVDFYDAEQSVDHFLTANGLPFADHYLEELDEVVWTGE